MKNFTWARAAVLLTVTALVAAGCGGGDEDEGYKLPLPKTAPEAAGPANGAEMVPSILLSSTDELEQLTGELDTSQVARRAGVFVSGQTAVGYSVDTIKGYDLETGEDLWSAKLDLKGGTVCFVSQPTKAVKQFTVVYGEAEYCDKVATIRLSDGKVLSDELPFEDTFTEEFEGGDLGGSIEQMFTLNGNEDYFLDFNGVIWEMGAKGRIEPLKRLGKERYFTLSSTPDDKYLIGSDGDTCEIDAYSLPDFEPAWKTAGTDIFPEATAEDCILVTAQHNPAWVSSQIGSTQHLAQLDPKTGKVLGKQTETEDSRGGPRKEGDFSAAYANLQLDRAWGLENGDMVFPQVGSLARVSLDGTKVDMDWDIDLSQTELETTDEFALTNVLPTGVTPDGYLINTISNGTDAEVSAIDVKSGKLAARWPLPDEYRNGFQVEPVTTLIEDGLILSRNFEQWEFQFGSGARGPEPEGDRFDLGVFLYPEPGDEEKAAQQLRTEGPASWEAEPAGNIKAGDGPSTGRSMFKTGSVLVSYSGSTVVGTDPKSGKQKWKTTLPDKKIVCTAPEPDRKVKSFTLGIKTPGEDSNCTEVVRVKGSDGEILDSATVPTSGDTFYSVDTYEGKEYLITKSGAVYRWSDGKLEQHADMGRGYYTLNAAAGDPSLVVGMTPTPDQKDYIIEAFSRPDYKRVWATTATKIFGKIDTRNYVNAWSGNGLWFSTAYGDPNDYEDPSEDLLVELDPATGAVAHQTGKVERDYSNDDPTKFSLTHAWVSYYGSVGFDDGSVIVEQDGGIGRYSLADNSLQWLTDTASIENSLEKSQDSDYISRTFDLVDGGKKVLVTLANNAGVEVMTLNADDGEIVGRWKLPTKYRNGLQVSPEVLPFANSVAFGRSYAWDDQYGANGKAEAPKGQVYDLGIFRLKDPRK